MEPDITHEIDNSTPQTRAALIKLVRGPYLNGETMPLLWETLRHNESGLRAQLANLNLELVIDDNALIAYVRDLERPEDEPSLIQTVTLTPYQTFLILYLRQRLMADSASGAKTVVSHIELVQALVAFEKDGNTNHTKYDKDVDKAINGLSTKGFLEAINGSALSKEDRRYVVPAILKLLFGPDQISALRERYQMALNQLNDDPPEGGDNSDEDYETEEAIDD